MGQRGPVKEPTALKIRKGNPGKHALPAHEPHPDATQPEAPDYLDDHAKEFWDKYAEQLNELGVLTQADGEAFAQCCQQYSLCRQLEKEEGDTSLRRLLQARRELFVYLREFGLTPSSRSRLDVSRTNQDIDSEVKRRLIGLA